MPNICAPARNNKKTCFKSDEIEIVKSNFNRKNPNNKIINENQSLVHSELLDKTNCSDDLCLFDKIGKGLRESKIFKPQENKDWIDNPDEWLSTTDIEKILKQYEDKYPEFYFYGASPIDICNKHSFTGEKVLGKLCDINIKNVLQKGKTKLGVVFNTDPHDKPGAHWFGSFMDLEKGELYLFDSNGISTATSLSDGIQRLANQKLPSMYDPIVKVLHKVQAQCLKLHKPCTIFFNTQKHQKKNTECGIYSLFFIINMLEGGTFQELNKIRIPDKEIFKFRKIFFRPHRNRKKDSRSISKGGGKHSKINSLQLFKYITDPNTLVPYLVSSLQGTKLLRKYIQSYLQISN